MKIVTISNWVLIGIYGLLVLYTLLGINRSGNDAAGRGMESGLVFFAALLLAGLIVLNILPYRATKIIALVVLALPALVGLYIAFGNYFELQKQRRNAAASEDGSAYFQDAGRQQIAAAIAAGDVTQLKTLLAKPLPSINEPGFQSKTLLDFAALTATKSDNPQLIMQCLDVLLEHGATFQIADSAHIPTQFQVCEPGSAELLTWFLNKGVDPNMVPRDGSPIIFKVMDLDVERLEKVQTLLDHGANPNAPAGSHEYAIRPFTSPLMYAAQRQSWAICELLLERGADPNYRTPGGDDLKKVLDEFEKPYSGPETMPVVYLNFKKKLTTKSTPKP
ncbi:ankyrin repeat domain-containing protein [Larkinella terrae]|uniref:Ankyrin repeat domain-containing protein n=1 Tax=Larkinella terrae TaxID=2025311 RepID=A0A7K0EEU9_9BACT|nr:ankyrin repeat domain-containing protein [Larkinella terrae]MRS60360.1 hypothetical protein [Larkinella terrae]